MERGGGAYYKIQLPKGVLIREGVLNRAFTVFGVRKISALLLQSSFIKWG